MGTRKSQQNLGRRERQIMDVIFELGEASVASVLERLPDPPSYSAVRTMIRHLEGKGYLRHRREGTKYVYRSTEPKVLSKATIMCRAGSGLDCAANTEAPVAEQRTKVKRFRKTEPNIESVLSAY